MNRVSAMSMVSFLITVCMVGSGVTGPTPDARGPVSAPASAPVPAAAQR